MTRGLELSTLVVAPMSFLTFGLAFGLIFVLTFGYFFLHTLRSPFSKLHKEVFFKIYLKVRS